MSSRHYHCAFVLICAHVVALSLATNVLFAAKPASVHAQQTMAERIAPKVETDPVPSSGDAADDPAIWIHPTDPSKSVIIGTDKAAGLPSDQGGLAVYDLDGREIQYVADGKMNNVDIRYNFPLGGERVDLVAASYVRYGALALYRINPDTRKLENVASRLIRTGIGVYGSCMYRSPLTGRYYQFVTNASGTVQQWRLFDDGHGKVNAEMVRTFNVGSQVGSESEGCVADDVLGYLYISGSNAIWKYDAEPESRFAPRQVDSRDSEHLGGYLEGLSLYYTSSHGGYLIVSDQSSSRFVVYLREGNNNYVTSFSVQAGNGIDGVTGTDGLDVTNVFLGPSFPKGVFVVHDGKNTLGTTSEVVNSNYKLVPWEVIASFTMPALTIDTTWDPRSIGAPSSSPAPSPSPSGSPSPRPSPSPSSAPSTAPPIFLPIVAR
ncbi:phytase [Kallotenue papyrolyticum]|uniref:phytase n=1 Tax=Kallotenue papyrolyticum TaxID=1325125 RepID=UPI0009DD89FD|nr:phytase [Kallotenue papyrolyticum]